MAAWGRHAVFAVICLAFFLLAAVVRVPWTSIGPTTNQLLAPSMSTAQPDVTHETVIDTTPTTEAVRITEQLTAAEHVVAATPAPMPSILDALVADQHDVAPADMLLRSRVVANGTHTSSRHCHLPAKGQVFQAISRNRDNAVWLGHFFSTTVLEMRTVELWWAAFPVQPTGRMKGFRGVIRTDWRMPTFRDIVIRRSRHCDFSVSVTRAMSGLNATEYQSLLKYNGSGTDDVFEAMRQQRRDGPDSFYLLIDGPERVSPHMSLQHARYDAASAEGVLEYVAFVTLETAGRYNVRLVHLTDGWEFSTQHTHYANVNPTVVLQGAAVVCNRPRVPCNLSASLLEGNAAADLVSRGRLVRNFPSSSTSVHSNDSAAFPTLHVYPWDVWLNVTDRVPPLYSCPMMDGTYRWVPYAFGWIEPPRVNSADLYPLWAPPVAHFQRCVRDSRIVVIGESHAGNLLAHIDDLVRGDPWHRLYTRKNSTHFIQQQLAPQRYRPEVLHVAKVRRRHRYVRQNTTLLGKTEHGEFAGLGNYTGVDFIVYMGGQFPMIRGIPLNEYLRRLRDALLALRRISPGATIVVAGVPSVMPVSRTAKYGILNYYRIKHHDRRNLVALPLWNHATKLLLESRWMQEHVGARYVATDDVFLPLLDSSYDGEHFENIDALRFVAWKVGSAMCSGFRGS